MRKFIAGLVLFIFLTLWFSAAGAADPLSPEQREWINRRNVIRVGVFNDYPPFGFVSESGSPKGMSIEFWRLLSSKIGFWVQFFPALFNDQLNGLKAGRYDSLAGIFPLKERQSFFDFTRPYTTIRTHIYVKPRHARITTLRGLRGFKVSAVRGDSGEAICLRAGLRPYPVSNYLEAILDLANGDTDAIVMDELVVGYYVKRHGLEKKVLRAGMPVDVGRMTLPVQKGETLLLEILDKGVTLVSMDEWKKIEKRWLPD